MVAKRVALFACAVLAVCAIAIGIGILHGADSVDSAASTPATIESSDTITIKLAASKASKKRQYAARAILKKLKYKKSMRKEFKHGKKGAKYQKYIVIHDTEGLGSPMNVVDGWDSDNQYVAAHFVIGRDGSVVQCVPLNAIAHHAGFGNKGFNKKFKVKDESRDDKRGTKSIGSSYPCYGMNSYSVGIELVHAGKTMKYPKAQLKALNKVIAYIDAFYGFESKIIDHKTWRTTNSDTSPAFKKYLKNYKKYRSYKKPKKK